MYILFAAASAVPIYAVLNEPNSVSPDSRANVFVRHVQLIYVCYEAELHQFDIAIGTKPSGRIVFKMFDDVVPQTTRNFRELATGQHGFGFAGSRFHRIIPGVSISGYISV